MTIRLGDTEIGLLRYLCLWLVVVVVFAVQGAVHDAVNASLWPPWVYLRWSMIQWLSWAVLAPLVFRLSARYPGDGSRRSQALAAQFAASIGVTLLALVIGAAVSAWFEPSPFPEQLAQFISKHAAIGMLTYWALFAIQQALHFRAEKTRREVEASRLATELAQSRLQALKSQLQPHFLFNTLHAIVTLLDEDKVSAEDMLLRLSELLRAFLEEYDGQEISLRQELALLDLYLGIQRTRFKDRLATRVYVAPDTLDCAVPSLFLQPIVENAIRHGIGQRVGTDCIEIESRREGDMLCLEVRNRNSRLDGEPGQALGHGIGLSNTRLRLRELHGDAAQVRLDMLWPEGVSCRVRMPFRELEAGEDAPEVALA
ncbi:histidine kinase [Luteimonas sp. RD2P54]|uniref:Histidine kinase n=1 Tax=Luteimonas endophytica TaxID=3042023 RepID=A0ABT6JE17_9GAMM|nr:histidine kinase [Luteimonas endophytica]MDH5825021.1 histidine kinase [Luteimonas endophytica]